MVKEALIAVGVVYWNLSPDMNGQLDIGVLILWRLKLILSHLAAA